ncbi:HIT family protein [Candidatus Uhrbacteria bacterium]|nr:HIT family protein [Candidatus Uhrbacteria bacterium]
MEPPCLFCEIVANRIKSHRVWEDENYLAFLTIFPNTEGVTVVIAKKHYSSNVFDLPENIRQGLITAAGIVAKKIQGSFDDVGRTGIIFEGFGVDHIHAKLFPMHGTRMEQWKPIKSNIKTFFSTYPGYLSSHDGERADDAHLADIAKRIREN